MVVQRHGRSSAAQAATAMGIGAALVCSTAGCTGSGAVADESNGDPLAIVRGAADVLERSGSSKTRTALELANGGTRVTLRGEGGFDYAEHTGRLTVSRPQAASGASTGEPVTQLIAPGDLYMKDRGAGVPSGKWVWVDTTSLEDGNLVTGGATDPVRAAELLSGAREARYEGTRKLDGVRVRHFSGTTDITAAARAANTPSRGQLAAAAKGFAQDEVRFDAYFDGQGRLRKVRHRFTFVNGTESKSAKPGQPAQSADGGPSGEEGRRFAVSSTTSMYAFGTPVEVVLPDPEDIYAGKIAAP